MIATIISSFALALAVVTLVCVALLTLGHGRAMRDLASWQRRLDATSPTKLSGEVADLVATVDSFRRQVRSELGKLWASKWKAEQQLEQPEEPTTREQLRARHAAAIMPVGVPK